MPYCLLRSFTLTIIYIFTLFQVASAGDEVLSNGMDVSQFAANQIADNDVSSFLIFEYGSDSHYFRTRKTDQSY